MTIYDALAAPGATGTVARRVTPVRRRKPPTPKPPPADTRTELQRKADAMWFGLEADRIERELDDPVRQRALELTASVEAELGEPITKRIARDRRKRLAKARKLARQRQARTPRRDATPARLPTYAEWAATPGALVPTPLVASAPPARWSRTERGTFYDATLLSAAEADRLNGRG